jgi:hypothetical protein
LNPPRPQLCFAMALPCNFGTFTTFCGIWRVWATVFWTIQHWRSRLFRLLDSPGMKPIDPQCTKHTKQEHEFD